MTVVFYVSGHGLGHATRDIEVMHAIAALDPDARIAVRTSAPRWIFERTAPARLELHAVDVDTGVAEAGDLTIDQAATVRDASRFYHDFDRRVNEEASWLAASEADLVVGDIPPLAFAAAARAGVPSAALGNFTWDWIYDAYPAMRADAPHVLPAVRRAYGAATIALRLPLHGGFDAMLPVTSDIPFVARVSTRDRRDTRARLGLPGDRAAVLVSLGRFGLDWPREALARSSGFSLVDNDAATLDAHGLAYADLVAAADIVISKPGYGIVSECVANGTALLYTSRDGFVEADMLAEAMPAVLRCRFLPRADLVSGRWDAAIDALLAQPAPAERPRVDGARVVLQSLDALVKKTSGLR